MTRSITQDDLFSEMRNYESRLARLERAHDIASPIETELPEGVLPDGYRVRLVSPTVGNLDWEFMFHLGYGWPWIFMGGPPLNINDTVVETRGPAGVANQFFALDGSSTSPVLPAGIYDLEIRAIVSLVAGTASHIRINPYTSPGNVQLGVFDHFVTVEGVSQYVEYTSKSRITLATDTAIRLFASHGNTSQQVAYRQKSMWITPVRLSPR